MQLRDLCDWHLSPSIMFSSFILLLLVSVLYFFLLLNNNSFTAYIRNWFGCIWLCHLAFCFLSFYLPFLFLLYCFLLYLWLSYTVTFEYLWWFVIHITVIFLVITQSLIYILSNTTYWTLPERLCVIMSLWKLILWETCAQLNPQLSNEWFNFAPQDLSSPWW